MRKARNADRCPDCGFRRELCICARLPSISTSARLVIIQHSLDAIKPSNTANLVARMTGCERIRYGGDRDEVADAGLVASLSPVVLYPAASSSVLSRESWEELGRPPIVILDGTWRQAAREASRLSRAGCSRFARLPDGFRGNYRLRKSGFEDRLCTAEAVAALFRVLGEDSNADALERGLGLFIEKNLLIRGRLGKIGSDGGPEKGLFV